MEICIKRRENIVSASRNVASLKCARVLLKGEEGF